MAPTELFRNAKTRSAWEIPQQTAARQLQRDRSVAHAPVKPSNFNNPELFHGGCLPSRIHRRAGQ